MSNSKDLKTKLPESLTGFGGLEVNPLDEDVSLYGKVVQFEDLKIFTYKGWVIGGENWDVADLNSVS